MSCSAPPAVRRFVGAARELGVEHHAVNLSAGVRVDGAWHVQNVNAYHSRLKSWIRKLYGVATCYLPNCLGGSALSTANMATARNLSSGWLWRLVELLNNMICEHSHRRSNECGGRSVQWF